MVDSQIEQIGILTSTTPKTAMLDRGYRDIQARAGTPLLVSHTRRLPKHLKKLLKRRQVVKPMIGHMKSEGLLDRNWLRGALGDATHAVLCAAGHRMVLAHLRVHYRALVGQFMLALMLLTPASRSWLAPTAR